LRKIALQTAHDLIHIGLLLGSSENWHSSFFPVLAGATPIAHASAHIQFTVAAFAHRRLCCPKPAPHHFETMVPAITFLMPGSALLELNSIIPFNYLSAIVLPTAGVENQWRTPACHAVTVWRHLWSS
jgi:hypothetical protein